MSRGYDAVQTLYRSIEDATIKIRDLEQEKRDNTLLLIRRLIEDDAIDCLKIDVAKLRRMYGV